MIALGMGFAWFGYSVSLWGYCLVKGIDVKLTQLINPVHPYAGGFGKSTWGQIPTSQVLPDGKGVPGPVNKLPADFKDPFPKATK